MSEETESGQLSPNALLALGVGSVLIPVLGPVAIVLADRQRKQAVLDSTEPHPRVLIARILGYVGTLILCIDVIAITALGLWYGFTDGGL